MIDIITSGVPADEVLDWCDENEIVCELLEETIDPTTFDIICTWEVPVPQDRTLFRLRWYIYGPE